MGPTVTDTRSDEGGEYYGGHDMGFLRIVLELQVIVEKFEEKCLIEIGGLCSCRDSQLADFGKKLL